LDDNAIFDLCRKLLYHPPPAGSSSADLSSSSDDNSSCTSPSNKSPRSPGDANNADGAPKSNARQRRRERRKLQAAQAALHAALVVETELIPSSSSVVTQQNLVAELASRILSPALVPVVVADAPALLDTSTPAPPPPPTTAAASSTQAPPTTLPPLSLDAASSASTKTALPTTVYPFSLVPDFLGSTTPCGLPCRVRSCGAYCTVSANLSHDIHACEKVDTCFIPCSDPTCIKVHHSLPLSLSVCDTHLCTPLHTSTHILVF
jgi:hypothetical protein